MDHGKFWSHVYHQKELCELVFSLLSGIPKPVSLFYHSLSQKVVPPTDVLYFIQKIVSVLIDFFLRLANHFSGPDNISRAYYDRILAAKKILRAEFIIDLMGLSNYNGPKQNPKLTKLILLINQKHPEVKMEMERMIQFLAKDMQAVQRNLIRCSNGTDSILDKEGELRERSELLWKCIEHGWLVNKVLEVFNIEYLDIFIREGGHYLLVNALLLISNKLVKWESLYQDGLVTPGLATYMATMFGKELEQALKNGLIKREEFAERDFANIRIFSSIGVCEFVERVSRFEALPRQIITKDGNLIAKYETAPLLLKLIARFNLRKFIEDLGPECMQVGCNISEGDRKEVLKSIMASLAGQAAPEPKQDESAPKIEEMDPEVLQLAQQFFNVDLNTIKEIAGAHRGNRNKIRDMLALEQYKPKKEEKKTKVKDEEYFKTYKKLVQKKYILPEGEGVKKRKKQKRNMLDDQELETDADMKAKVLELTYQGSHGLYEDDYDESKHQHRVTGLIQQKKQEKESDSEEDKFEDQQIGGEFNPPEQSQELGLPPQTFPEDNADSKYYEPRADPPKEPQQIKSYGNQWVIQGELPPQQYHNDSKSANLKKWQNHHQKHYFHHNRKPERGGGAGRGFRGKGRGGRKTENNREFDSGYNYGEQPSKPKYVKKQ